MAREHYEQRLFRIFAQAGYSPVRILTVTPEEMVKIPGITVPNIRTVLCIQRKVLSAPECVRQKYEDGLLLRLSEENRAAKDGD
ncbi:MAG: hypothetical protein HDT26_14080 [Subdoligranulum sp.]|nr:hypothetical protein [Subdoligranulum sp.]